MDSRARARALRPQTILPTIILTIALLMALSVQAQDEMTDADITLAVMDALTYDPGVSGYLVDVETDNGIVTLSGSATNLLAKRRAARLAETIKGVRSVVNNITVKSLDRPDMEVRDDVVDALAANPATDTWEIEVTASDGVVELNGVVNSWYEKQLAAKVTRSVRGVMEVDNELGLDYEEDRPAAEIAAEVREKLRWDELVDDALITVEVDDNEVTLSGTVGSAAEKRYAISDAWVDNVEAVDAEDLEVADWARDERFRTDKYVPKSDEEVAGAIRDALFYDPRVASFDVEVSVNNGVVTLSGVVDNLKAKRAASQVASNTVGVWTVKNQMSVRPAEPMTDAMVAADVRQALLRDPYVNRYDIDVTVDNGIAYLNGDVDTFFEKAQADDVAAQVNGVVAVENNLDVQDEAEPLTFDPYVDYDWWYLGDYDWYTFPNARYTVLSDWEIKEEIEDEFFWSPFVDSEEVTVSVD
ncbi:BON domain-containing protein, partial [candidate division GN15 bacterium]|nr:BON domain-containing protein [candidate division GN15 bacterium]